jgi:hypothetical protein
MLSQIIVAVWYSYSRLKCIPKEGRFYRKPLDSKEPGDVCYGQHPVGVNSLSKYLNSMCTIAKINMDAWEAVHKPQCMEKSLVLRSCTKVDSSMNKL